MSSRVTQRLSPISPSPRRVLFHESIFGKWWSAHSFIDEKGTQQETGKQDIRLRWNVAKLYEDRFEDNLSRGRKAIIDLGSKGQISETFATSTMKLITRACEARIAWKRPL